ncbi:MAG: ribonuclease H-like domain-containing protein [Elusimicrobiota bacterium]|jgi:hypothetical protein
MSFAYLDIETAWDRTITVIGIYRRETGTTQLVAPRITRKALQEALIGVSCLFTYNGSRFDLPVIERFLGLDLRKVCRHRDLMHDCLRAKLKGGLKSVERQLGIHRDTEGVDGLQAMTLWATHVRHEPPVSEPSKASCCDALDLLLRYNREDVENLEIVTEKLGIHA